jgi:uncharacterized protein (DUF1810 family)
MNTSRSGDSTSLVRFVDAQADSYATALAELIAGRKRRHWIWYILPQMRGLGVSQLSNLYGIASLNEARAYLAHPILGPRLRESVAAIGRHKGARIEQILGDVDALKYRSCLTLFKQIDGESSVFARALDDFFEGREDERTLELLSAQRNGHA